MRKNSSFTKGLAAALLCSAMAAPLAASAADLTVPMDQVRIVTFRTPVKTVFVGNPLIADVTVVDSTRIFLMGKNFGTTNLVALDENGNQVSNDRITVQTRGGEVVTLHRGSAQTTMACVQGRCQSAPLPGDEVDSFTAVNTQMSDREEEIAAVAGVQQ
jgi:Flp pilus assembly secretin CpaC